MRRWLILVVVLGAGCQSPGVWSRDRTAFGPVCSPADRREALLLPPAPVDAAAPPAVQRTARQWPDLPPSPCPAPAALTQRTRFGLVLDVVRIPVPVLRPIAVTMLPQPVSPTPARAMIFADAPPAVAVMPPAPPAVVPAPAVVLQQPSPEQRALEPRTPELRAPEPAAAPEPLVGSAAPTHALVSCEAEGVHTQVVVPIHARPAYLPAAEETPAPPRPKMAVSYASSTPGFLPPTTAPPLSNVTAYTPITPAMASALSAEDIDELRRMVEALEKTIGAPARAGDK